MAFGGAGGQQMGLAISVGQLAFLFQHESREEVEMFREELRAVNRVLALNGLPAHAEPESLPEIEDRVPVGSMPYGWLHHVRRAVAYAMRPGERFRPLREKRLSDNQARAICNEPEESHPHWVARQAWLYVYERLRQSVEFRAAAVFG
jgi:hypothetical protein